MLPAAITRILKDLACWCLILTGVTWLAAWCNRRKGLVLVYHNVHGGKAEPLLNFDAWHVRASRFTRQMRYLSRRYRVVSLDRLLSELASTQQGRPLAAITIDDGYRNTYRYAYPILRALDFPATIFPIVRRRDERDGRRL